MQRNKVEKKIFSKLFISKRNVVLLNYLLSLVEEGKRIFLRMEMMRSAVKSTLYNRVMLNLLYIISNEIFLNN